MFFYQHVYDATTLKKRKVIVEAKNQTEAREKIAVATKDEPWSENYWLVNVLNGPFKTYKQANHTAY